MKLLDHITDTLKEWELKMGRIDSDIRLYYPPDSIIEFLKLSEDVQEDGIVHAVKRYLEEEAPFLGNVKVMPAKDHRIGIAIPKEGSEYVAENIPNPVFLKELLQILKKQDLEAIKSYFHFYAEQFSGQVLEEAEDDGEGTVLYFDRDEIDPYVYCFDCDNFGVTYHRFSKSDYEKIK